MPKEKKNIKNCKICIHYITGTAVFSIGVNSNYWSEYHFAIDPSGAQEGDEYEFRILSTTKEINGHCLFPPHTIEGFCSNYKPNFKKLVQTIINHESNIHRN